MQAYSDPRRADDPHALPDVEVFQLTAEEVKEWFGPMFDEERIMCGGWFWWSCLPGCMPDSDPVGPFATEAEALADAQGWTADNEPCATE